LLRWGAGIFDWHWREWLTVQEAFEVFDVAALVKHRVDLRGVPQPVHQ
jgi:hypothetical protein